MKHRFSFGALVRRGLVCWLGGALTEYLLLSPPLRILTVAEGLSHMSLLRLCLVAVGLFVLLSCLPLPEAAERWALVIVTGLLGLSSLFATITLPFLFALLLLTARLVTYALRGRYNGTPRPETCPEKRRYLWITAGLSVAFFLFVSLWGVSRVRSFSTPTYDFGIFSQMFHSMRATGLPVTTLERDTTLSHFAVHMSPIYYLLLPFYCLYPKPETLQVLQGAVITSAVIPLWLLGKHHGLKPPVRMLLCALLLLYPAFSGGTSYDLHENCFLTPLLLWLLYGLDTGRWLPMLLGAVGTLLTKEDAAVYVAVVGLWEVCRRMLKKEKPFVGLGLLAAAIGYFLWVTNYLSRQGDGVMTYRYKNFMFGGEDSLLTVIKAVILCPMKAVFECVDPEKLSFLALTLCPLLGLPLMTRRYERYVLLIPYILINLMSDYTYQHSIFFQYTFGSTALLFYLTAVNLRDFKLRLAPILLAVAVSIGCFVGVVVPKAIRYPGRIIQNSAHYRGLRQALEALPGEASVATTTFYSTVLSSRAVLYDIGYCTRAQLLSCRYIAIDPTASALEKYGGLAAFRALLEEAGYRQTDRYGDCLVIFERKS